MAKYIGQIIYDAATPSVRFSSINEMFEWLNEAPGEDIIDLANNFVPDEYRATLTRGTWINTIPDDVRYRNAGALMYDGEDFINLNYDYSDYGIPPLEVIPEFTVQKWALDNCHNCFVMADLSEAKILECTSARSEYFTSNVKFLLGGNIYNLIIITNKPHNMLEIMEDNEVFSSECDEQHDYPVDPEKTIFHIEC